MSDFDLNDMHETIIIVAAYVAHNPIPREEVPGFIESVHRAVKGMRPGVATHAIPFVDPKKSVTPTGITCLDCGRTFKTLRRHIHSAHGLNEAQYRERWGLPLNYPFVAKRYSEARSGLAKASGLGRKKAHRPAKAVTKVTPITSVKR